MTEGSGAKLEYILTLVVILAAAGTAIMPSFGEVVLLHTQQPYTISANRTVVAEDVDPSSGVVWLKLYSRNETLKSSLLGVGGHFDYDHTNITVNKIYAGGQRDLVEIWLNKSSSGNTSGQLAPAPAGNHTDSSASSTNLSTNSSPNLPASPKASAKTPAIGASAFFAVVLAMGIAMITIKRMKRIQRRTHK